MLGWLAQTGNQARPGYTCPAPARRLAEITRGDLQTYVNSLVPTGQTYHDIGMVWGARFISPRGIFAADNETAPNGDAVARHIVFMTDEDDCTPTTPDLFNPGAEELGGYGPFRCWQWGLRCNEPWQLDPGQLYENYTGCRPLTEGEGGKLRDVSRYVNELNLLVNSDDYRMFVQAVALTGPHQTDLTIVYDPSFALWEPQPVADTAQRPVMSNLRLYDFAWRMSHLPDDMQWCFFNLLSEDWELPLGLMGQRLRDVMERSMEQQK
ncbi:MAG: hypothetical protein CVU59_08010 [Deltaproteobacteria bacterium HGW-Deltaproteobacteria-17]|nr:MAG: hypothetical protein CVU59_08010 [Deltaproteobacteria bacterium HGW-Deltaproteobacteria-17]